VWLVLHLMIAGRLHGFDAQARAKPRASLLMLRFDTGLLTLAEAGTKRRAALHLVQGSAALDDWHAHKLEVLEAEAETFMARRRYGQLCPVCGTVIQRFCYAKNKTNYCSRC
jgi:formamidopyrimidine-DNA glycosylase